MKNTSIPVILLCSGLLLIASSAKAQEQADAMLFGGTVNIALGNENGLVVLTDSKETTTDPAGQEYSSPAEIQKLIALDDRSVCAIAGFSGANLPSAPQFNVAIIGILEQFREQFANRPESFAIKLRTISIVVQTYISAVANVNQYQPRPLPNQEHRFKLFLAGYDIDGALKLGQLQLSGTPRELADGKFDWSFTDSIIVVAVGSMLLHRVQGFWDVGEQILSHPELYQSNSAVQKYSKSLEADGGASMALEDMEAVAEYIATKTSEKYPNQVGGSPQVCIFQAGKMILLKEPSFPPVAKPMTFVLMDNCGFISGDMNRFIMSASPFLFLRCTFRNIPLIKLDGQFFVANAIENSVAYYDGGTTIFDTSNTVTNSSLFLGPNANKKPKEVCSLMTSFLWTSVSGSLPRTMCPRPVDTQPLTH